MRISKINIVTPKIKNPAQSIKIPVKREDILQKCAEIRQKKFKDLTVKDAPFIGAVLGLFSPIPFGFLVGYGAGKAVELTTNFFKKKG